MLKISNKIRFRRNGLKNYDLQNRNAHLETRTASDRLPLNSKLLAWGFFLIFFIESGTLGLIPKQFYFVYRNIRISDLLIYFLTAYSLFNTKEFAQLYRSKTSIVFKAIIIYFFLEFIISVILYDYNLIEYFFRLKSIWTTLLFFPFLLLLKRNGLHYLIKLILPVAIVSNILYILSAVTGTAFLPEIGIQKQSLPGGLQVYRVYGGTFMGELFFLGYIYEWITKKFRLYQLPLVILFVTPHILAFGRSAWVSLTFSILVIAVWNILKKKNFKIFLRQAILFSILGVVLIYTFMQFIPQSNYLTEALGARVEEGQENIKNETGTYGTRIQNIEALLTLWSNSNIFFGIGMHPMWVLRPETEEENIYAWGFSDVRWASVLAAYGLIGFILAVIFQIYYGYLSLKVLKRSNADLTTFCILILLSTLMFDSFINYSYYLLTVGLLGINLTVCLFLAALVFKYEYPDEPLLTKKA